MQIFTFFYQFKKMLGKNERIKAERLLADGLSESFEPSEKTVKNIMAYADAYRHSKSQVIEEFEYIIN